MRREEKKLTDIFKIIHFFVRLKCFGLKVIFFQIVKHSSLFILPSLKIAKLSAFYSWGGGELCQSQAHTSIASGQGHYCMSASRGRCGVA